MNLFLCYPKCSTCRTAQTWLKEQGVEVEIRDLTKDCPTQEELRTWHEKSGLDIKRFFNTSGNVYKELQLKDKFSELEYNEKLKLLAAHPMLIKRPILITEDKVVTGFKKPEWESIL